jgi:malate dehydrogenase (oxaloacetate-decarboxylating)
MKLAAARAIAAVIPASDLGPEYIVPSVFNRAVAPAVADAVAAAAIESGIARRDRRPQTFAEDSASS